MMDRLLTVSAANSVNKSRMSLRCSRKSPKRKADHQKLTPTKLYPAHTEVQPLGQSGTRFDWLWTAIDLDGASHTMHLLTMLRMIASSVVGMFMKVSVPASQ